MSSIPPAFLDDGELSTTAARTARDLHSQVHRYADALTEIGKAHREAVNAVLRAERAIVTQVREAEQNPSREVELAEELKTARVRADDHLHRQRLAAAQERFDRSVFDFQGFVRCHLPELVSELAPEAEAAWAEYEKAIAAVAPAQARLDAIRTRTNHLLYLLLPFTPGHVLTVDEAAEHARWALPMDGPPLPSPEVVSAWAASHPSPEQATPPASIPSAAEPRDETPAETGSQPEPAEATQADDA